MNSKRVVELAESYFKIDLSKRTRKREVVYMRSIVNKLCREFTKESLDRISLYYKSDHATILFSIKQFDDVYKYQKEPFDVYNKYRVLKGIIKKDIEFETEELIDNDLKEYSVKLEMKCNEYVLKIKKLQNRICLLTDNKESNTLDELISDLKTLSDSQLYEFHETRLKPFKKSIESRKKQKI